MQHLDEGTIHAWLDGALPAEDSAGVERHVAVCTECASLVAEARGMIAGASRIVSSLDVVPGGVIPKSSGAKKSSGSLWRSLRFTPSRAALAATLVIAVSTVLTLRHDTDTKIVPMLPAPAAAPVVAVSPPPAAPTPAKEESRARQAAKRPAMPAAADEAARSRRDVTDARTQIADSARAEPKNKPLADVAAANRVAQGAAAAPPASATASGGRAVALDSVRLAKVSLDSTRASAKRFVDSAARARPVVAAQSFARKADDARAREATALLAERTTDFAVGCYQLTDSTAKDIAVPTRFALDLDRADPGSHIVRAMSPDGAADTIITRASWQQPSENTIDVRFRAAGRTLSLTIRFPTGSVTGVVAISGDGPARTAGITRFTCRR